MGLRGGGRSYGDAPLNSEAVLVDLSRMNRILEWDPELGILTVEPGVTVAQLWRYALGDGWWPAVVPGTMRPTIGGCVAMNIHGKNNWQAGPIGDHVLSFEAMLSSGEMLRCDRETNPELFHGFIGGLGLLGCFTRITLSLKRIHSGNLSVLGFNAPNIHAMLAEIDRLKEEYDYVVGWVDCMTGGAALGRGQIHAANHLPPEVDPAPHQSLRIEHQDLPDTFFGLVPRSVMWRFMKPMLNNPGVRLVNWGRFRSGQLKGRHRFVQSLVEFNFLLDYIPGWKRAYLPGGLIQHQAFIPEPRAAETYARMLDECRAHGLPAYLGVLKRHRPDDFLLSHSVDGYSLALDFKVTRRNRARLLRLMGELDEIVLAAGGRFYFAKDSTLQPESVRKFLGEGKLSSFAALKRRCDPDGILQTNLSRRVLPDLLQTEPSSVPERLLEEAGAQ